MMRSRMWCGFLLTLCLVKGSFAGEFPPGVVWPQERVITLPDDSQKWYLTVIVEPGQRHEHVLRRWFAEHEHLSKLAHQCHFHIYRTNDAMYRERYARFVGTAPAVLLQESNGAVVFAATGIQIPMTADTLYDAMRPQITEHLKCPWCVPQPTPEPKPAPRPEPQPAPVSVPPTDLTHLGPPDAPEAQSVDLSFILQLIGTLAGGGGIGGLVTFFLMRFLGGKGGKLGAILQSYGVPSTPKLGGLEGIGRIFEQVLNAKSQHAEGTNQLLQWINQAEVVISKIKEELK
jgi:hypothetical protein